MSVVDFQRDMEQANRDADAAMQALAVGLLTVLLVVVAAVGYAVYRVLA